MRSQNQSQNGASSAPDIEALETALTRAWTGAGSTPFLAEAPISAELSRRAENAVRSIGMAALFTRTPTLAVWGVLTPLARDYDESRTVYRHIGAFIREDLDDAPSRDDFKRRYRAAARRIGLPVAGNDPTGLFFAPLGPPRGYHDDLAEAFVAAALALGPPAIEDAPSARQWQRRAVVAARPGLTRLLASVAFDQAAWLATRFTAWRRGDAPIGDAEAHLFEAYDTALARRGRRRSDLVAPPRLFWTGTTLAFEIETTRLPQTLDIGLQPRPVRGGSQVAYPPPWRHAVTWSAGSVSATIPAGPGADEVLVFDATGGGLLARTERAGRIEVAATHQVVLARRPFTASGFGPAVRTLDTDCFAAWTEAGAEISFEDGTGLEIATPRVAALWLDADVLGRCGALPLHGDEGWLELRLEPGLGAAERIVRARIDPGTRAHADRAAPVHTEGGLRFAPIVADDSGTARLDLAALDLATLGPGRPSDPRRIRFEVLAPGAAGDPETRAELAISAWIWPGMRRKVLDAGILPAPTRFIDARSAGLRREGDVLHVDLRADTEGPILGLDDDGEVREFRLSIRTERLWHVLVADGARRPVPRQARLVFGHANRHDSLLLRSEDRDADLVVLGRTSRRPFLWRSMLEIPASALAEPETRDPDDPVDDRILLRRADGRQDVLAHLVRVNDPDTAELVEDATGVTLTVGITANRDALGVRIEDAAGRVEDGATSFSALPVDAPLPEGVEVRHDPETRRAVIRIARSPGTPPGIARISLRDRASGLFEPLRDADGAQFAVALEGAGPATTAVGAPPQPDLRIALQFARFLAEPAPLSLGGQVLRVLGPHYAAAMRALGTARMVGRIQPVVALGRNDGGIPRHDLVGVAPWLFEAPPAAFRGLPPGSGLAPLATMADLPAPEDPPDPSGVHPLEAWLDRVASGEAPAGLAVDALVDGFRALRSRLRETELRLLVGRGPDAAAAALLGRVHIEAIDRLRAFDHQGGGDARAAEFAALLERFARATALGRAEAFLARLSERTGLETSECGRVLTLILRAGPEIFACFRSLWHHAGQHHTADRAGDPGAEHDIVRPEAACPKETAR
jgi:hypothetical protein